MCMYIGTVYLALCGFDTRSPKNNMLNDGNCNWTVGLYVGLTSERKVFNTMEELITYY